MALEIKNLRLAQAVFFGDNPVITYRQFGLDGTQGVNGVERTGAGLYLLRLEDDAKQVLNAAVGQETASAVVNAVVAGKTVASGPFVYCTIDAASGDILVRTTVTTDGATSYSEANELIYCTVDVFPAE